MKNRMGSNEAASQTRRGGSREAIVEAAERLFLERGFGSVTMDELAEAAGVARRTLYNQFASKEEIFREMLLKVSSSARDCISARHRNPGRGRGRAAPDRAHDSGAPQKPGIPWISPHGSSRLPPVSLDCRGVRRRHGTSSRAARALSRACDCDGHPGLPQSDACGAPVHGDAQPAVPVALDDGSRAAYPFQKRT